MKKKIILTTLLGATTSLMALGAEMAYLYKDPRIMGMGGANISVGSYSTSIFSNPAGLANIKKEDGFVVDVLGVAVSASGETANFIDDIDQAETNTDMAKVLKKYGGEHFHIGVDNYSSISKNSDLFAWTIGLLAAADGNFQAHPQGSLGNPGLLATTSRAYGGLILGGAIPFETDAGRIDIGVGLKYITQNSYEGSLGISELVNSDDIVQDFQDKYETQSSGYGLDLGITYSPFEDSSWHPAFALSVLNIGDMSMDDHYGGQPMTVNVGASVTPEVPGIDKLVLAIDYVDMLNANIIREYTYSATDEVTYRDYEDSDFMKRLRLGVGIGLIDSTYFAADLNFGMYQSAYTAGFNMRATVIKLNIATYEEQVGTGSVDIPDRRYVAQIGIGW